MSKSIIIKVLICTIFILILGLLYLPKAYAIGDIFTSGKEFLQNGKDIDQTINTTALKDTSDTIYNILFAVAVMVAIIVAMILGIQFMWASADEKAKVKEALMPFVVGCIVVFGSFTIWKIAINIGNDAENSQTTSATYTKQSNGKLYCDDCGDELSKQEQHRGQCSCGYYIKGI